MSVVIFMALSCNDGLKIGKVLIAGFHCWRRRWGDWLAGVFRMLIY
ncbi:hypothetical protein [Burkholderia territorii]|nr:hypothetical protein [Burkholderia territorii]